MVEAKKNIIKARPSAFDPKVPNNRSWPVCVCACACMHYSVFVCAVVSVFVCLSLSVSVSVLMCVKHLACLLWKAHFGLCACKLPLAMHVSLPVYCAHYTPWRMH